MIRYHTIWVILCQIVMGLSIIMVSCRGAVDLEADLSSYYFPVDSFPAEGMVYTYRNVRDTAADYEVWRHIRKGAGMIESLNYDFRQEVVQRQFDRFVTNGVVIDSLILYFEDSVGVRNQEKVIIHSRNKFPFQPGDSTNAWLTHLEWWQPGDSLHVILQRRRRFAGHTTWNNNGKAIPAVRFRTEDVFETELDGWTDSAWSGEEIYARHIGLVYYRREISSQLHLEFELVKRE